MSAWIPNNNETGLFFTSEQFYSNKRIQGCIYHMRRIPEFRTQTGEREFRRTTDSRDYLSWKTWRKSQALTQHWIACRGLRHLNLHCPKAELALPVSLLSQLFPAVLSLAATNINSIPRSCWYNKRPAPRYVRNKTFFAFGWLLTAKQNLLCMFRIFRLFSQQAVLQR